MFLSNKIKAFMFLPMFLFFSILGGHKQVTFKKEGKMLFGMIGHILGMTIA